MSTDGRLGARKLRHLAAVTGMTPVCAWAWGRCVDFVTDEHGHYQYDKVTGDVVPQAGPNVHYGACRELWP